jgi:hypothetical protein
VIEITCQFCGKKKEVKQDHRTYSLVKRKYCSRPCAWAGQKKDRHWRDGSLNIKSNRHIDGY